MPLLERAALDERLANDAEARQILAEYRALDATLKSAMPIPDVGWDELTSQIRGALADVETPVRHFSLAGEGKPAHVRRTLDAPKRRPQGPQPRIRELEAKLRRAEMERDILKKATAYFAVPHLTDSSGSTTTGRSSR